MSQSSNEDFDPTKIDLSSSDELPQKRPHKAFTPNPSSLPNPLDLINTFKNKEKPKLPKKPPKKSEYSSAVISKAPVMSKIDADFIEQYDYFASESTAILDNWKSAQEIPDKDRPANRSKFVKKVNFRKTGPEDITSKLERELARREKQKSGLKKWKQDDEVRAKQQYDS